MIEAVIFDVDGTLVDSVDFHAEAWQKAFAKFGKDIAFQAIRSQIGKGGDQLLPVFLSEDEIDTFGKKLETFRGKLFKDEFLDRVEPFRDVPDLLRAIRQKDRRVALASSAKSDELKVYKKIAGVDKLTDIETSSDDAEKSKPHPDIFQAALKKLKLEPDEVLVIGDTPYDADAARKAGIASIGVLCGGFSEEDIRAGGASRIYRDPQDLLVRIDEWLP